MTIAVEPVFEESANLGEGPVWSPREKALYWLDLLDRIIWRHDAASGETARYTVDGMPASFATHGPENLLVAFRNRLSFVDLKNGQETNIPVPIDFGVERFNDGKCDRRGRFFVGTMDKSVKAPVGGLYRVDRDLSVTQVADGIRLSNGLSWSPDDKTLYHNDSRPGYVYAYDYDIESGTVENRRIHIDFTDTNAHPDGSTIDAEGCLWVAEVGAGTIGRYDPDGKRMGGIELPTQRASSVMFGGEDLSTLYITTMRYNLTEEQLAAQPLAGRVFKARPGVSGIAEVDFAG